MGEVFGKNNTVSVDLLTRIHTQTNKLNDNNSMSPPLSNKTNWLIHHVCVGILLIITVSVVANVYAFVPDIVIRGGAYRFLPTPTAGYFPIPGCPPPDSSMSTFCNEQAGYQVPAGPATSSFTLAMTRDFASLIYAPHSDGGIVGVPWSSLTYDVACNVNSDLYVQFTSKIVPNPCPADGLPSSFNPPWQNSRENAVVAEGYAYSFCVSAVVFTLFSLLYVPLMSLNDPHETEELFGEDGYARTSERRSHVILLFIWSLSAVFLIVACICGGFAKQSTYTAFTVPRQFAHGTINTLPMYQNISIYYSGYTQYKSTKSAHFAAQILVPTIGVISPPISTSDVVANRNSLGENGQLEMAAFVLMAMSAGVLVVTVIVWLWCVLPPRIFYDRIQVIDVD